MKTVYKAQNLLVYRVSDEGEIQFRDTTRELGWKRSEFLTLKAQQLGLPAQEILDKEARRQGWIVVKEAPQSAPIASDAQSSPCPSSGADVPTEEKTPLNSHCKTGKSPSGHCGAAACCNEPYDCCAQCPNDCNSRCGWISAKEETVPCKTEPLNVVTVENSTSPSTSFPAATAAAEATAADLEASDCVSTMTAPVASNCEAAGLAAGAKAVLTNAAVFDYSCLDQSTVDTLHLAERMIRDARRDYITKLAQAVYIVHDTLCGGVVAICDNSKHGHRGEDTFRAWCASVGLGKDTAYRLLQVAALLNGSTPEEQAVLESASPSLLYAAAKPSAPAELVEGVKSGDITTHKKYQELLAQLKAKEQELASERADWEAERASTSALLADEQHRRQDALRARLEAEKEAREAKNDRAQAQRKETLARHRADEAEKALAGARDALTAAKARGDHWQEKAKALEAQAAAPAIEAKVVDPEEMEQLAAERAEALAAQQIAQRDAEDARAAYDAVILATRSVDAAWQALVPMLPRLAPEEKSQAIHQFVNKLMCMKEDALKMIEKEKKPYADHQN